MQPSLMDAPQPQQAPEQPMQQPQAQPSMQAPLEMPAPQEYPEPYPQEQGLDYRQQIDEIEALIESIIEEKWQSMIANVGDLNLWKQKTRTDIRSIKQEIIRLQTRFENLEKAILGKISSYDQHITNVGTELKAMEKVFQKILQPLTTNIKELQKITKKLKK